MKGQHRNQKDAFANDEENLFNSSLVQIAQENNQGDVNSEGDILWGEPEHEKK